MKVGAIKIKDEDAIIGYKAGGREILVKARHFTFLSAIIILVALSSYFPALAEGSITSNGELDPNSIWKSPQGAPCDFTLGYPHPDNIQPANGDFVNVLKPNFKWNNPFVCDVPGWELQVWRDDPFGPPVEEVFNLVLNADALKFQMTFDLDKNTRYRWLIGPSDYFVGPVNQNHFGEAYFWTGPFCEFNQLLPPKVIGPENGSIYGNGIPFPSLDAKHPGGCLVKGYEYQVSSDPTFGGTLYQWGSFHTNTSLPNVSAFPGSISTSPVNLNCSHLYWRLRSVHEDGQGPWSETSSFYVNLFSDCPTIYDLIPDLPLWVQIPDFPWVWPIQTLNCRLDDLGGRNIGTAFRTQPYQVLAMNPEGTHARINLPEISVRCFVPMSQVFPGYGRWPIDLLLLARLAPVFNPDLVPTPTPIPEPEREAPPDEKEKEKEKPTPTFIVVEEGRVCIWTGIAGSFPNICAETCPTGYADSGLACSLP